MLEFRGRSDSNSVFPVGKLEIKILFLFKILSDPLNIIPWTQPACLKFYFLTSALDLSLPEDKAEV